MNNKGLTKTDSLALKGIAIIMLLFYHCFRIKSLYANYDVNFFPLTEEVATNIVAMFKMCVSIFAFITGFGLLESVKNIELTRGNVVKWNISRLLKTMSGFYFVYIIAFVVTMIIDQYPIEVYFSKATTAGPFYIMIDFLGLNNLFGTPSMLGTWWYMSAAIIFILLIPVILGLARKTGYLPIIFILIMLPRLLNTGYPGGMNVYPFILCVVFGMMFAEYSLFEKISVFLQKKKFLYVISFIFLTVVIIYYYFFYSNVSKTQQWEFQFAIFPIFVILFARYFVVRIPGIKQVLVFFGTYSMNMFLTHNFLRQVYLNEFLYSFKNFALIVLVLFVLSLILAMVLEGIKKLIRYDKFINNIINKLTKGIDKLIVK